MDRLQAVTDQFGLHFEVDVAEGMLFEARQGRFCDALEGWEITRGPEGVKFTCWPARIASNTDFLDDAEFLAYLETIEFISDVYVTHMITSPELGEHEWQDAALDALALIAPKGAEFYSQVRLQITDRMAQE